MLFELTRCQKSHSGVQIVFQLRCQWQGNVWGKKGKQSEVAKLLKSSDPNFEIGENTHYAELWMGTHRKWPSMLNDTSETLESWIKEHTSCLGNDVQSEYGDQLPFLFKVLSIEKTLSLQAHPGKELAEKLHHEHPDQYLDANHKPEICIALAPFRGLCGFRPISEIAYFLKDIEEFTIAVGKENAKFLTEVFHSGDEIDQQFAIKRCFAGLLNQSENILRHQLSKLVKRIQKQESINGIITTEEETLLKVYREYPDDVGCFSVYFLNIVQLQQGEAIFIDSNVTHAYLEGDCVECMSCSDNVLRGGFTAKYKDTDTLIEMLDYNGRPADEYKLTGSIQQERDCIVRKYAPQADDFAVDQIKVPGSRISTTLLAVSSVSILICIEGTATMHNKTLKDVIHLKRGTVLFIAAYEECMLRPCCDLLLFRAYVPLSAQD